MNQDRELQIQAFVDGELSARQARKVEEWLATDAEAQALLRELQTTKTALAENEPQLTLPETREFYWNKIQRQIEAAVPEREAAQPSIWLAWRRYLAPVTAVAAVAMLALFSMKEMGLDEADRHLAEIENLSEHASSLSFRSQSENMFVVWVYNKDQQQSEEEADFADEAVIQ
jgi:anti-sigma factor RsiW